MKKELNEAIGILEANGYLIEKEDTVVELLDTFEFKKSDYNKGYWNDLTNYVFNINVYEKDLKKLLEKNIDDIDFKEINIIRQKIRSYFRDLRYIINNQKLYKIKDSDLNVSLKKLENEIIEKINEKSNEKAVKLKKEILKNTNFHEVKRGRFIAYAIKDFEYAIRFDVDWVTGYMHKNGGLLDYYYILEDIHDKLDGKYFSGDPYFEVSIKNINTIENWLKKNKDFVDEKCNNERDSQQSMQSDINKYYKGGGRNWSGD